MDQVETVALWVGLLGSVISIVLAVVALWFTFSVDRRAQEVNTQMVKSLQKIESTVERSAGDTVDLIKVAWERLLGSVPNGAGPPQDEEAIRAIAAGVAAELKQDARTSGQRNVDGTAADSDESHDDTLLQRRLEQLLRSQQVATQPSPGERISAVVNAISALPAESRALVAELVGEGHLTADQYRSLAMRPSSRGYVRALRDSGYLVPLRGQVRGTGEEDPAPVYWFPPGLSRYVKSALSLTDDPGEAARTSVRSDLQTVGYARRALPERPDRGE